MRTYLQIIINHQSEQTPTIILHSGNQKYMFNCSENFMRFQKFNKIRCVQAMCFFLTRLSSETLDGLLSNMTTLFSSGMAVQDKIYGPHQIVEMFQAMKSKYYTRSLVYSFLGFSERKEENNSGMANYLLGINDISSCYNIQKVQDFQSFYFESVEASNNYIFDKFKYHAEQENLQIFNDARTELNNSGNYQDSEVEVVPIYVSKGGDNGGVLAYLVKLPAQELKMNKEKIKQLNIPNKMMKEMQQNGQIELNGEIIKLEQILEESKPAPHFLIFDCVSEDCVKNIMESQEITYKTTKESILQTVIHLTPIHILKSTTYEIFLKQFSEDTQHIFVNSHLKESKDHLVNLKKDNQPEFQHIEVTNKIAEQFPENFPTISENSKQYKSEFEFVEEELDQLFPFLKKKTLAKRNYQLVFYPKKGEQEYQPMVQQNLKPKKEGNKYQDFENLSKQTHTELVKERLSDRFIELDQLMKQRTKEYDPHIYFLGTTCMTPTPYRNNSCILVYENNLKQGIMLDCGDGTYYQLLNQFGEVQCQEVLRNLKLIILTHAHSDHCMGFQSIVYQRKKAFEIAKLQNKNYTKEEQILYIALPWNMSIWYAILDKFTEKMNCKIVYFQDFNGQDINGSNLESRKEDDPVTVEEETIQLQNSLKKENGFEEEEKSNEKQQNNNEDGEKEIGDDEEDEDNNGQQVQIRAQLWINQVKASQKDNSNEEFKKYLMKNLGIEEIQFIPVIHCMQAFGIVFKHKSGVKISYSGDTRPCREFALAAEGSDLMIHEGTFNFDCQDQAKATRHSTSSEAISIALQAKSQALILTHLSKRHSKLDIGDFTDQTILRNQFMKYQTSLALDHLQFKLSEYFSVPFISRCANLIFTEDR